MPERIGRYHLVGYLATGGMAEILLGKMLGPGGFEQAVVIKRALPHLARQAEFRDMFLDEARVVARIQHPNVVKVTELGEEGSDLYMVMEYLAGESVAGIVKRLAKRGEAIPRDVAIYVMAEVLAGLHAAHELVDDDGAPLGLIHRDVSPHNLFVTYDGRVKLLDFGIAKFLDRSVETHTGTLKGKFAYMSPEQCVDEPIDRRSDLFAAGTVLWELLAGERLFKRSNELLTWKAIVEDAIPTVSERVDAALPEGLDDVVMSALERDPDARPATAAALRRDLLGVLREIDPEEAARDRLVALLERTFEDRIEQKRELLRRVRAGDEVTSIPSAEIDLDELIEVTVAATEPDVTPDAAPARRPRWIFPAAAGVALLLGAGLVLWLAADADEAPVSVLPPLPEDVESEPAPEPPRAEPTPPPPPEPAAEDVVVELQTEPPGATVFDEEDRALGTTPLRLELPPSETARALRIELDGYREHTESVVPDVNQRLRVALRRAPRASRRAPRETPEEAPSGGRGFYRFD